VISPLRPQRSLVVREGPKPPHCAPPPSTPTTCTTPSGPGSPSGSEAEQEVVWHVVPGGAEPSLGRHQPQVRRLGRVQARVRRHLTINDTPRPAHVSGVLQGCDDRDRPRRVDITPKGGTAMTRDGTSGMEPPSHPPGPPRVGSRDHEGLATSERLLPNRWLTCLANLDSWNPASKILPQTGWNFLW
jgi:hypothetical protein